MNCLFCKIVSGELSSKIVYRDDFIVAFEDIHPQAPHHVLIVPQKHIASLNDVHPDDQELIGHMVLTAKMLAKQFNVAEEGYRVVLNTNAGAGQSVFHVHIHLLGGRPFHWPPG